MVYSYYEAGRIIVEEEQDGAAYGKQVLKELLARLTKEFGKGFSVDNLKLMRRFYKIYSKDQIGETSRQYGSSLYERLILSRDKETVMALALKGQEIEKPKDLLKDPYVLEFTGIPELAIYTETELETKIIDNLQKFLLELGRGFTFVGRQVRFTFEEEHYRVDLVLFYVKIKRMQL